MLLFLCSRSVSIRPALMLMYLSSLELARQTTLPSYVLGTEYVFLVHFDFCFIYAVLCLAFVSQFGNVMYEFIKFIQIIHIILKHDVVTCNLLKETMHYVISLR